MSRQTNHDRDLRWDGWPIAAEGVAVPNYPVIDPTDPDWVAKPTPWDGIDESPTTPAPVEKLTAALESLKERFGLGRGDVPNKTPG